MVDESRGLAIAGFHLGLLVPIWAWAPIWGAVAVAGGGSLAGASLMAIVTTGRSSLSSA